MMRSGTFSRKTAGILVVGGALVGVLVAGIGSAQDAGSRSFAGPPSFADVVEQVRPAVVTISVTKDPVRMSSIQGGSPFAGTPFDDFFERFGGDGWSMPAPQPVHGEGSGFIVDSDGYVATNNHVVDGASDVVVTLISGEELPARVVGIDAQTDLALLKIDSRDDLPSLELGDSDHARVGDWVLAIGNPFGLGGSATAGIISARGRDIRSGPYDDYLQIDAPINSGNSGGPVFNAAGEVIGVNTAIFSPNGGNIGIGFAIPSNQAKDVLDQLREQGSVSRGWLGVEIRSVGSGEGGEFDRFRAPEEGAEIARVVVDGPADRAGLASGDVVVRLDGEVVDSPRTLSRLVAALDAGDEVDIEYLRDGERRESQAVLGMRDEDQLRAAVEPPPSARQQPKYREYEYRYQRPEFPRYRR